MCLAQTARAIDRDHHGDEFVERSWQNFPDPDTYNLLVWRRREIENYFLDPPFLVESEYCEAPEPEVTGKLVAFAQQRLFLDIASSVILSVREEQKRTWTDLFSNPDDFASKDEAVHRRTSQAAFEEQNYRARQDAISFRHHCPKPNITQVSLKLTFDGIGINQKSPSEPQFAPQLHHVVGFATPPVVLLPTGEFEVKHRSITLIGQVVPQAHAHSMTVVARHVEGREWRQ